MPNDSAITVRLPEETRQALDRAAQASRRSRAFIVKEALDRHLKAIVSEEAPRAPQSVYDRMKSFRGAGARRHGGRTAEEIAAMIREIRGED